MVFSTEIVEVPVPENTTFGKTFLQTIPRKGDLIKSIWAEIEMPSLLADVKLQVFLGDEVSVELFLTGIQNTGSDIFQNTEYEQDGDLQVTMEFFVNSASGLPVTSITHGNFDVVNNRTAYDGSRCKLLAGSNPVFAVDKVRVDELRGAGTITILQPTVNEGQLIVLDAYDVTGFTEVFGRSGEEYTLTLDRAFPSMYYTWTVNTKATLSPPTPTSVTSLLAALRASNLVSERVSVNGETYEEGSDIGSDVLDVFVEHVYHYNPGTHPRPSLAGVTITYDDILTRVFQPNDFASYLYSGTTANLRADASNNPHIKLSPGTKMSVYPKFTRESRLPKISWAYDHLMRITDIFRLANVQMKKEDSPNTIEQYYKDALESAGVESSKANRIWDKYQEVFTFDGKFWTGYAHNPNIRVDHTYSSYDNTNNILTVTIVNEGSSDSRGVFDFDDANVEWIVLGYDTHHIVSWSEESNSFVFDKYSSKYSIRDWYKDITTAYITGDGYSLNIDEYGVIQTSPPLKAGDSVTVTLQFRKEAMKDVNKHAFIVDHPYNFNANEPNDTSSSSTLYNNSFDRLIPNMSGGAPSSVTVDVGAVYSYEEFGSSHDNIFLFQTSPNESSNYTISKYPENTHIAYVRGRMDLSPYENYAVVVKHLLPPEVVQISESDSSVIYTDRYLPHTSGDGEVNTLIFQNAQTITDVSRFPNIPSFRTRVLENIYSIIIQGYTDSIAYAIFEEVSLVIGGQHVETLTSESMELWSDLTTRKEHDDYMLYNIGRTYKHKGLGVAAPFAIDYGQAVLENYPRKFIVPLGFYFNRSPELAVPLFRLDYHDVEIGFKLRELSKLVYTRNAILPDVKPGIRLFVEYFHLDSKEKDKIPQQLEFNIPQMVCHHFDFTYEGTTGEYFFDLDLKNAVRELYFVFQKPERLLDNDYFTYEDCVESLALDMNGETHLTHSVGTGKFLKLVHPSERHTSTPKRNFYVYSFSIDPESIYPDSYVNMSRFRHVKLRVKFKPLVLSDGSLVKLRVWSHAWNVLSIQSGLSALLFG